MATISTASATLGNNAFVSPQNNVKNMGKKIAKNIDVIQIEADDDYYSTSKQIEIKNKRHFVDSGIASKLSTSELVSNLFSRPAATKRKATQQTDRTYLSSSVSADAYRTGIEISEIKQWVTGLVKISAGTPGHIINPLCYGIAEVGVQNEINSIENDNALNVIERGAFREIDLFNPLTFISLQESEKPIDQLITFPIVTSDNNQLENYILNGIIEPFPIRPVISNFSINVPFEPQGVRGAYGNGNMSTYMLSDEVLSVDYYDPKENNETYFLDEGEPITMSNGATTVIVGTSIGYFNITQNYMLPFEDKVPPRGEELSSNYPADLAGVVSRMLRQGEVYVTNKQRSSTSGFVYDGATKIGTDSIAFGGMLY